MQQRVRRPHRGTFPSSSGQLPVPVALNARSPTLFGYMILESGRKVNSNLHYMEIICQIFPDSGMENKTMGQK